MSDLQAIVLPMAGLGIGWACALLLRWSIERRTRRCLASADEELARVGALVLALEEERTREADALEAEADGALWIGAPVTAVADAGGRGEIRSRRGGEAPAAPSEVRS